MRRVQVSYKWSLIKMNVCLMVAHLGSPSVEQGILQSAASRLPPSTILPQSYRDFDPEAHPELKNLPDPSEIRGILGNLALRSGQKLSQGPIPRNF